MPEEFKIVNNEQQMHFEIHESGEVAFLEYRFHKNAIAFMHTVVPPGMKGKGAASALTAYAFQYAKENNKSVMIYCPFVAIYVKRHPEVQGQIDHEPHS